MKKIIILSIILFVSSAAYSQAGSFLTIPVNARSVAMGQTYIGQESSSAVYTNLAASGLSTKSVELDANYRSWLNGLTSGYNLLGVNGYFTVGNKGAFAVGFTNYTTPGYTVTDDNGAIEGEYNPKELSFALGYAYKLSNDMALSLSMKYMESDLAQNYKANSVAFDFGFSGKYNHLTYGAVVKNLGPSLKFDSEDVPLPLTIGAGVAYKYLVSDAHQVNAAFDMAHLTIDDNSGLTTSVGLEYEYLQMVALRAGYHFTDDQVELSALSLGAGVKLKNTQLNFSWLMADNALDNNYNISLVFNLHKTQDQ